LEAFGEKLRRQREQRGITLEAISSTTKISTRMLRALEEEHFDQLPGGVFNKGFIRAYARQVGLDEEEAITDYLAALHASQLQSQKILPDLRGGKPAHPTSELTHHLHEPARDEDAQNEKDDEKNVQPDAGAGAIAADADSVAADRRHRVRRGHDRRNEGRRTEVHHGEDSEEPWRLENRPAADLLRSVQAMNKDGSAREPGVKIFATGTFGEANSEKSAKRVPWGTLAVALLVICAVLTFWNVRRHRHPVQLSDAASQSAAPSPTSAPPTAEPPPSRSSSTSHSLKAKLEGPGATKLQKTSAAKPEVINTQGSIATAPAPHSAASETAATNSETTSTSLAVAPASKSISQSSTAPNLAPFTLLIRAEKTSWVSITADGKLVAEETLIAPAEKSVRASDQIVVKAGNAAGISFLLNAKEIPAQGKDGEVRMYTFDASGVKVSGNAQITKAE
jgi:cytoskeletal protein RodZ